MQSNHDLSKFPGGARLGLRFGMDKYRLSPPPAWLHWLFLAAVTLGAIRLTSGGAGIDLRPLLGAVLVMVCWLGCAQKA